MCDLPDATHPEGCGMEEGKVILFPARRIHYEEKNILYSNIER